MIIYNNGRLSGRLHINMKFKKNILRTLIALAVVAGLIWLLYTYAQNILTFLNGSVNVLSEVVSSDTTHAFVRWVGMLLPAIIWVFVFVKCKPGSLTMFQRSVRNVVLWSCGLATVCILWTAVGKDVLEEVMLKSSTKSTSTTASSNGWTVDGIKQTSWLTALLTGVAGFLQLWKKGQYIWRGWVCLGICLHILCAHFMVWISRLISNMLFGGWYEWLDMTITVGIYAWWTVIFFFDSAFNTKVVSTDRIGVFVLWERRLSWGNKIPAGPVALPFPKWLGLKVETESAKTETVTLETANDKPVVIQAGSAVGKPFPIYIKATFKFVVEDPIKAKTAPLDEQLRRQVIEQALTEELQTHPDITSVRKEKKTIAVYAVMNPTSKKGARIRFHDSGYKLLSIDITSAERDPKLEAAELEIERERLEGVSDLIDNQNNIDMADMYVARGMPFKEAINLALTNKQRIRAIRYQGLGGNEGGGKGKGKNKGGGGKNTAVILPP